MTVGQLKKDMKAANLPKEWRYGQAAFNFVHRIHPAVANVFRATDFDPFHTNDEEKVDNFLQYCADLIEIGEILNSVENPLIYRKVNWVVISAGSIEVTYFPLFRFNDSVTHLFLDNEPTTIKELKELYDTKTTQENMDSVGE